MSSATSSDYDSDPTTTVKTITSSRHVDHSNTIFKSYLEINGHDSSTSQPTPQDLLKIQSFLNSSSSGALSCLICLERIKNVEPTWSCTSSCFAVFHLHCIQSWAHQSTSLAASRALTRLPISAEKADVASVWSCPKCRFDYPKCSIPKKYTCFCGKVDDPVHDPWVLPHSCGELCGRSLRNECGHLCVLLCHPGPCPSCPKLVKCRCFCGGVEDVRRCGFKEFSCNKKCCKILDCGAHTCREICHEGDCPPCREKGVYRCQCGKVKEERECCDRIFRCENPCGRGLECGKHVCERGCHGGECGECPFQGKRSCPCGKRVYEGMACDVEVPLCGATCDKRLSCGRHRCPDRCHRRPCEETCRIVITKSCRCGSFKKQIPCHQDLVCERKCNRERDCGRHACRRRCCDGDCPPCTEVCDRKLRCRNHKCPSPCHRGPCAPCPLMVTISCSCGTTHFEVPCGTEKEQKPPRCRKLCHIDLLCRHRSIRKPHKCHYGACPPCTLPCGEEYPCGHACKLRCHGPRPPPNLEFTLKPKKKKQNYQSEPTAGTPCPPCPELVWRPCVGQHLSAERMLVCSDKSQFACDNLCGNPLACGNHYCTKTCHALWTSASSAQLKRGDLCEECTLPCQKERKPTCSHPCPQRCHPGECPPCKALLKRSCHCGAMVHVFECIYYNSLSDKEQLSARSCGGPCHRKLPDCTHLCPEICHPGRCPSPEKCSKKVSVRCGCNSLKKEWLCQDVRKAYKKSGLDPKEIPRTQFGVGLLPCDSSCKSKVQVVESDLQLRKPKPAEKKIETENGTHVSKRRKRRDRVQETKQVPRLQKLLASFRRIVLLIAVLIAIIAVVYFGYKGLLLLNDWMNEVEESRERRRYQRP